MTANEAIRRIAEHNRIHSKKESQAILITEAMDMAIEALEKQIPTKVTHEATLYKSCTCPRCMNVVDKFEKFGDTKVRVRYDYCCLCGQKLDWSGEE